MCVCVWLIHFSALNVVIWEDLQLLQASCVEIMTTKELKFSFFLFFFFNFHYNKWLVMPCLRPMVCASKDMSVLGQNFDFDSSRDPPHSGVCDRIQGRLFWILWIWAKNWWRTLNSPHELHQEQITKRSTRYDDTCKRPQYSDPAKNMQAWVCKRSAVAEDRSAGRTSTSSPVQSYSLGHH